MGNKVYLSNDDFMQATEDMIQKVKKFGFKKKRTAIIAVARGGLIPAQYLAYALGIRNITTVGSTIYNGDKKGHEQTISNLMAVDYDEYDNFIVVDDIYDSGDTMQGLLYGLGEMAAAFKADCNFIPCVAYTQHKKKEMEAEGIIYGQKIKKVDGEAPWLVFPWDHLSEDEAK